MSSSTSALLTWFTHHGGWLNPDIHLHHSPTQGHHARALRPTTANLLTCPLALTLSRLNLAPAHKDVIPITSQLQLCRDALPNHILSYLILIEQRARGSESPWCEYIACLPRKEDMTTPLWFDDEDEVFLAGTGLAPAAKERKADLYQQWENAVRVMKEVGVEWAGEVDFTSLLWAATIFTSRAFISTHILPEIDTLPILFPVLDLLNHSVSAKVEWDFKPHHSFTLRSLESASFKPGDELFNNYAPKQNDELLLGYGFCLENNPIEQFALKLAFQPQLQQYARQTGLLDPSSVPFGMDTSFLSTDPNKEQHFLRTKNHPFGRYTNHIPFFRGIPPYIVHFFFIQTLLSSDTPLSTLNVDKPGERITLQVLIHLHTALAQRSTSLPQSLPLQPRNRKQAAAKIYRDAQAAILHAIRLELETALSPLLAPKQPTHSTLLSLPRALAALAAEYPSTHARFSSALRRHNLTPSTDGGVIWTLLLTTYAALVLTNTSNAAGETASLLVALSSAHRLPALDDGIEEPDAETYSFVSEHLDDFLLLDAQNQNQDTGPIDVLDALGETFVQDAQQSRVFIDGPTEYLGVRLVMWALRVVAGDVYSVAGEGMCLYVPGTGEAWMYDGDA